MPATDGLQPPLTPAERQIIKSYGGWTLFMQSYGLKAWDSDHIEEAHSIVTGLAALDEDAAQHEGASQGTKAAK